MHQTLGLTQPSGTVGQSFILEMVLTLILSFTGYLLPWDQLAFWAITVGTNIAGYACRRQRGQPAHSFDDAGPRPSGE